MGKVIDPFEEFLRKKKVEKLEQQYRGKKDADEPAAAVETPQPPGNEDPESEARLQEEVADFFESGQTAGVELFQKMSELSDDQVEEIKDALDDVFEEDEPQPQEAEDDGTFVNFFRQVSDETVDARAPSADDADASASVQTPEPAPAPREQRKQPSPAPKQPAASRPPHPLASPSGPEAASVEPPAAEPAESSFDLPGGDAAAESSPSLAELEAAAAEASADDLDVDLDAEIDQEFHDLVAEPRAERIRLEQILLRESTPPEQRLEAVVRVVARLAERAGLPESELIEALIKAGVEF